MAPCVEGLLKEEHSEGTSVSALAPRKHASLPGMWTTRHTFAHTMRKLWWSNQLVMPNTGH